MVETDRTLRAAAVGVGALTLALVATTVVLVVATEGRAANQYDRAWAEVVAAVIVLVGAGAGLAIVLQRPRNVIGWIVLVPSLTLALEDMAVPAIVTTHVLRDAPTLLTEVVAVVSDSLWLPSFGLSVAGLFLLFPDGRFVGPRSRRVFQAATVASLVFMATTLVVDAPLYALDSVDNPLGIGGTGAWLGPGQGLSLLVVFAAVLTGLGSLVIRWRGAVGRERAQLKWFLAGAAVVPLAILPVSILGDPTGTSGSAWGLLPEVAMMAPLVAIAVAILRHDLYGIDRLVSRTVTYTAVTATLVAVYALLVVLLQAVLAPVAPDSDLAVAGSTLGVAALFGPVVRRVRGAVDRRFDRAGYDAARSAQQFNQRLRDTVALDDVVAELGHTVATTVHPAHASVWLSATPREPRP